MDRRAAFFLGAAFICAILIPVTEQEQRWVPVALAVLYVLLAIASFADRRTKLLSRSHGPTADAVRHTATDGDYDPGTSPGDGMRR